MNSGEGVIHCIGDSHVDVFSGRNIIQPEWPIPSNNRIPLFKTYRLGAVLAYNISRKRHPSYLKLKQLLKSIPKRSVIMIVAGEIDCRAHIVKQSHQTNKSIRSVAEDCVNSYFPLLLELKNDGYQVIGWGPVSTTPYTVEDKNYPTVGTFSERNLATSSFNKRLQELCIEHNIPYISIYSDLYKKGKVQKKFYIDLIHLSTKSLPLYYKQLAQLPNINKKLLNNSREIPQIDLTIQTFKRKALYFFLIQAKFYPIAQQCLLLFRRKRS